MELGSRIDAWLTWKGWDQSQLADAAKLSRGLVCQVIGKGAYKTTPSQKTLTAIVVALGLTFERFYGRVPKPTKKRAKAA